MGKSHLNSKKKRRQPAWLSLKQIVEKFKANPIKNKIKKTLSKLSALQETLDQLLTRKNTPDNCGAIFTTQEELAQTLNLCHDLFEQLRKYQPQGYSPKKMPENIKKLRNDMDSTIKDAAQNEYHIAEYFSPQKTTTSKVSAKKKQSTERQLFANEPEAERTQTPVTPVTPPQMIEQQLEEKKQKKASSAAPSPTKPKKPMPSLAPSSTPATSSDYQKALLQLINLFFIPLIATQNTARPDDFIEQTATAYKKTLEQSLNTMLPKEEQSHLLALVIQTIPIPNILALGRSYKACSADTLYLRLPFYQKIMVHFHEIKQRANSVKNDKEALVNYYKTIKIATKNLSTLLQQPALTFQLRSYIFKNLGHAAPQKNIIATLERYIYQLLPLEQLLKNELHIATATINTREILLNTIRKSCGLLKNIHQNTAKQQQTEQAIITALQAFARSYNGDDERTDLSYRKEELYPLIYFATHDKQLCDFLNKPIFKLSWNKVAKTLLLSSESVFAFRQTTAISTFSWIMGYCYHHEHKHLTSLLLKNLGAASPVLVALLRHLKIQMRSISDYFYPITNTNARIRKWLIQLTLMDHTIYKQLPPSIKNIDIFYGMKECKTTNAASLLDAAQNLYSLACAIQTHEPTNDETQYAKTLFLYAVKCFYRAKALEQSTKNATFLATQDRSESLRTLRSYPFDWQSAEAHLQDNGYRRFQIKETSQIMMNAKLHATVPETCAQTTARIKLLQQATACLQNAKTSLISYQQESTSTNITAYYLNATSRFLKTSFAYFKKSDMPPREGALTLATLKKNLYLQLKTLALQIHSPDKASRHSIQQDINTMGIRDLYINIEIKLRNVSVKQKTNIAPTSINISSSPTSTHDIIPFFIKPSLDALCNQDPFPSDLKRFSK
jgi:hypothetical protein